MRRTFGEGQAGALIEDAEHHARALLPPRCTEAGLGASISLDGVGEELEVRGAVRDLDGHPISGGQIETWQATGDFRQTAPGLWRLDFDFVMVRGRAGSQSP